MSIDEGANTILAHYSKSDSSPLGQASWLQGQAFRPLSKASKPLGQALRPLSPASNPLGQASWPSRSGAIPLMDKLFHSLANGHGCRPRGPSSRPPGPKPIYVAPEPLSLASNPIASHFRILSFGLLTPDSWTRPPKHSSTTFTDGRMHPTGN